MAAVGPVDHVVDVVRHQWGQVKDLGEVALLVDNGFHRDVAVEQGLPDGVAIGVEEVAGPLNQLVEFLAGAAATDILVGQDLAELVDGRRELP